MYYHENLRKAREYLNKRQKQMEVKSRQPVLHQAASIRQIFAIIRQKDKSESEVKLQKALPLISLNKKDETTIPLFTIQSSNTDFMESKHSITSKLFKLNKITTQRTEMTPSQYNFMDRIIEVPIRKQEVRSEQSSPVKYRKIIPGNATERKYCIQQIKEPSQQRGYHGKYQKTENYIPTNEITSGSNSPILKRLNQTSYVGDKGKILHQMKQQPQQKEQQLLRQMSGWTVQSQESLQTPC